MQYRGAQERLPVFRRQSKSHDGSVKKDAGDVTCVYTNGAGGDGVIQDVDVRCWLPCIDTPDQRAIFDITIKAPIGVTTVACGRKVGEEETQSRDLVATRYVTSRRLAAYSVGFFRRRGRGLQTPSLSY